MAAMQERVFESEAGAWSVAFSPPPPDLAPYVTQFCETRGVVNYAFEKLIPSGRGVFMVNLGPSHHVLGEADRRPGALFHDAWLSGQYDRPLFTAPSKRSDAFETHFLIAELTPMGIYALFGVAANALTNMVVEAEQLFGRGVAALRDRIGESASRAHRFAAMTAFLRGERDRRARQVPAAVRWAIERTLASEGNIKVAALCEDLGVSRKHLNALYRESVGLSPKMFARLTRFQSLLANLEAPGNGSWARRAVDAGYFDQSHMHRDFAQFTGETPADFLSVRTADGSAVAYDDGHEPLT